MRLILALATISALASCRGFEPGPQEARTRADPVPQVTNDGFYDGGVFDQDLINPEPGTITRQPL
jgi:hypothetical protein